jgi:hypothetical protein
LSFWIKLKHKNKAQKDFLAIDKPLNHLKQLFNLDFSSYLFSQLMIPLSVKVLLSIFPIFGKKMARLRSENAPTQTKRS